MPEPLPGHPVQPGDPWEVTIEYPMLTLTEGHRCYERVQVKHTDTPNEFELTSHTIFMPLAPGDVVTTRDHDAEGCFLVFPEVTGIATLVDVWTLDVDFALPADLVFGQPMQEDSKAKIAIDQTIAEWRREAWATQHTGLSAYVSAQTEDWLEDRVVLCPYVDHVEKVRWPGMDIDWDVAQANADLGELTKGPWA